MPFSLDEGRKSVVCEKPFSVVAFSLFRYPYIMWICELRNQWGRIKNGRRSKHPTQSQKRTFHIWKKVFYINCPICFGLQTEEKAPNMCHINHQKQMNRKKIISEKNKKERNPLRFEPIKYVSFLIFAHLPNAQQSRFDREFYGRWSFWPENRMQNQFTLEKK